MLRVFNCGIGMALVVGPAEVEDAVQTLTGAGETVYRIGTIDRCGDGEPQTTVTGG
jgi:phosphoribosylformylglycinamidine cyclo-ligase